jgi:hypothetical protein
MRGRKSADMALGNGSANRQQRWGNGKGTNCTAEHVLSHSNGYYYIIVLYISLSCMLASLGKADAGCDDPCPCQPDKAIDGETFTALLSSRRHVCSQDSSLGVSGTAREQERNVVDVESCHVIEIHATCPWRTDVYWKDASATCVRPICG